MRARSAWRWLLVAALLLPAAWQVRTFASVLVARLAFPLDLEWMESGHLYQAWRIAHGLPIYVDPASGFAPFPYPPLFWILVAAAGRAFGFDYATGRAVSDAALAGALAILALAVARVARSRGEGVALGLVAAGGIAAGYPFSSGTHDLARSDATATFFAVAAAALAGDGRPGRARAIATGAALVAAVYTKQTDVFFLAAILAFVAWRDRRRGLALAAGTIAAASAIFVAAELVTHGWFGVWLFDQSRHAIEWRRAAEPLGVFVEHAPLLVLLPVVAFVARRRLSPASWKWLGVLGAAVAGAMVAHVKRGGWYNVYVPVLVLSWPVAIYVVADAMRALPERASAAAFAATIAVTSLVLALLAWPPERYLPSARARADAARLHAFVRDLDGDVVVTTSPFVAIRDGRAHPNQPILQSYVDARAAGMNVDYAAALDASGARFVITTGLVEFEGDLPERLGARFERVESLDLGLGPIAARSPELWRRR